MKKRSLIASIAMLLVSAIVLSTSTYAWFSAGATVSVDSMTAKITQTDGSIEISADNSSWGPSIDWDDFNDVAGNVIFVPEGKTINNATAISNLKTLSATKADSGISKFVPASLTTSAAGVNTITSGATFTNVLSGTVDVRYVYYKFYVKAGAADTKVTITPTFTVTGDKNFVLGAVCVNGSETHVFGKTTSVGYDPLNESKTVNEATATKNNIVDASEAATGDLGTHVSATNDAFTNIVPGTAGIPIEVWIWAEGQESTCTGSVSGLSGAFSFSIATV